MDGGGLKDQLFSKTIKCFENSCPPPLYLVQNKNACFILSHLTEDFYLIFVSAESLGVDSEFSCLKSMFVKKNRIFFFDRTELRDYWELCTYILDGNSLNYIIYEK